MTTPAVVPIREDSSLDDLQQGHSVIIAARWMLVAAGLMFVRAKAIKEAIDPTATATVAETTTVRPRILFFLENHHDRRI